jgi:hypothetical protein
VAWIWISIAFDLPDLNKTDTQIPGLDTSTILKWLILEVTAATPLTKPLDSLTLTA